ncbi:Uncharacterised protein [Streptococcus pneumoniae]|nr:Uncharacterised protein [Streptococcus pneumoniae]VMH56537.1 Uncharacterised protein [Streptococcus pneumoniae]VMK51344.1 Uncharacterised protein [Streptococcus pneumoniae]VMU65231.1 Uncharacterised protein [Streptococcus pneumoniae]VNN09508.1 Uncharacterised protein [Streptococcus pneumoniae]
MVFRFGVNNWGKNNFQDKFLNYKTHSIKCKKLGIMRFIMERFFIIAKK